MKFILLGGGGAAAGSMDAANMLKPALARGEIQCIGATTLDEYRKNIEKDGALERRFQKSDCRAHNSGGNPPNIKKYKKKSMKSIIMLIIQMKRWRHVSSCQTVM